jgi:ribonucleotide monophosphatase NagD (HAD superfamily)
VGLPEAEGEVKKNPFAKCRRVCADPYGQHIYIATTRKEFNVLNRYLSDMEEDLRTTSGIFATLVSEKTGEKAYILGWFNEDVTTLAHELVHACFMVLDDMGVKVEAGNNEALAYLHTYLMRKIMEQK